MIKAHAEKKGVWGLGFGVCCSLFVVRF